MFDVTGLDLRGLDAAVSSSDFARLAELKKSISHTEHSVDSGSDEFLTASVTDNDEANDENVIIAFNAGRLCRLDNYEVIFRRKQLEKNRRF
jgi:hypothetical protein